MTFSLWKCNDGTYDIVNQCDCCGYGAVEYTNVEERQIAQAPELFQQLEIAYRLVSEARGLLDWSTGLSHEFDDRAGERLKAIQAALARYQGAL